jgi:hypothetical protein
MRRPTSLLALLAALLLAGCAGELPDGDGDGPEPRPPVASAPVTEPDEEVADYDLEDPAYSLMADSEESDRELVARLGTRADYRVPRKAVAGLRDGPLAHAVIARVWNDLELDHLNYARLDAGQRAVYALTVADFEILDGGLWQLWFNSAGALGTDLVAAAHRVGAPEYEAIFRDAIALFPGGVVPRERTAREEAADALDGDALAELDTRYAKLQYHRRTALAIILGDYAETHLDEFTVG